MHSSYGLLQILLFLKCCTVEAHVHCLLTSQFLEHSPPQANAWKQPRFFFPEQFLCWIKQRATTLYSRKGLDFYCGYVHQSNCYSVQRETNVQRKYVMICDKDPWLPFRESSKGISVQEFQLMQSVRQTTYGNTNRVQSLKRDPSVALLNIDICKLRLQFTARFWCHPNCCPTFIQIQLIHD